MVSRVTMLGVVPVYFLTLKKKLPGAVFPHTKNVSKFVCGEAAEEKLGICSFLISREIPNTWTLSAQNHYKTKHVD